MLRVYLLMTLSCLSFVCYGDQTVQAPVTADQSQGYNCTNKGRRMFENGQYWVDRYGMTVIKSGAYGSMFYADRLKTDKLPDTFPSDVLSRSYSMHFQLLIMGDGVEYFRKFPVDSLYHWYGGFPLMLYYIDRATGKLQVEVLGPMNPIMVVPAETYFGGMIRNTEPCKYVLYGCTVSPGATEDDMLMATYDDISLSGNAKKDAIISRLLKK